MERARIRFMFKASDGSRRKTGAVEYGNLPNALADKVHKYLLSEMRFLPKEKKVRHCNECPHIYWGDWCAVCHNPDAKKMGRALENKSPIPIPDWCPLESIPKKCDCPACMIKKRRHASDAPRDKSKPSTKGGASVEREV